MKDRLKKDHLSELISQPTEITHPSSECPVNATNAVIKSGLSQHGWSFNEDTLFPSQMRHLEVDDRPVATFHGHLRELPGGIDERAFFIGQKEWEQLPPVLKEIILNSK